MVIDTHAHLIFTEDFPAGELPEVLQRAKDAGVSKIINVGISVGSCVDSLRMACEHEGFLYATVGMHPYDSHLVNDEIMAVWEKMAQENPGKIVAVGECGIDYFKSEASKEVQKAAFRKHLELARKVTLPVIIHNREADEDCLQILDAFPGTSAVFHCFGSSLEFAREVWKRGFYTSFTGIVTYPKAEELREVVKEMPLDLFMVETDCPYLAPQAYRGKRNEPAYVLEVVKDIARVRGISFEEVARISSENAKRLFALL